MVIHNHVSRLREVKKKSKEEEIPSSPQHSTEDAVSDSQEFFNNAEFLQYIDEVVEKFQVMKALNRDDCPKFDLLTPEPKLNDEVRKDIDKIIQGVCDEGTIILFSPLLCILKLQ